MAFLITNPVGTDVTYGWSKNGLVSGIEVTTQVPLLEDYNGEPLQKDKPYYVFFKYDFDSDFRAESVQTFIDRTDGAGALSLQKTTETGNKTTVTVFLEGGATIKRLFVSDAPSLDGDEPFYLLGISKITDEIKVIEPSEGVAYLDLETTAPAPDNQPPDLPAGGYSDITSTRNVALNLAALPQMTDPEGSRISYSFGGLPPGVTISPSTLLPAGVPTTAGIYTVTITGRDNKNAPTTGTFTWTIVNPGGDLTITSFNYDPVTGVITVNKTSSNITDPVEYSAFGLRPEWSTANTFTVPEGSRNGVTFTIKARQAGYETSAPFTTYPPPDINLPPVAPTFSLPNGAVGAAYSQYLTLFTDPNGDTLAHNLTGIPAGLSVTYLNSPTRVLLSGVPTTSGTFQMTYSANDGENIASTPLPIVINQRLALITPTYNSTTRKLTAQKTGGDNTAILYRVTPFGGTATAWQAGTEFTLPSGYSDPVLIEAQQSGLTVSLSYNTGTGQGGTPTLTQTRAVVSGSTVTVYNDGTAASQINLEGINGTANPTESGWRNDEALATPVTVDGIVMRRRYVYNSVPVGRYRAWSRLAATPSVGAPAYDFDVAAVATTIIERIGLAFDWQDAGAFGGNTGAAIMYVKVNDNSDTEGQLVLNSAPDMPEGSAGELLEKGSWALADGTTYNRRYLTQRLAPAPTLTVKLQARKAPYSTTVRQYVTATVSQADFSGQVWPATAAPTVGYSEKVIATGTGIISGTRQKYIVVERTTNS